MYVQSSARLAGLREIEGGYATVGVVCLLCYYMFHNYINDLMVASAHQGSRLQRTLRGGLPAFTTISCVLMVRLEVVVFGAMFYLQLRRWVPFLAPEKCDLRRARSVPEVTAGCLGGLFPDFCLRHALAGCGRMAG